MGDRIARLDERLLNLRPDRLAFLLDEAFKGATDCLAVEPVLVGLLLGLAVVSVQGQARLHREEIRLDDDVIGLF